MPWFNVRVSDRKGNVSELQREAASEEGLVRDLTQQGYTPIAVRPTQDESPTATTRFRKSAVQDFTEVLGELLRSGLSLKDALEIAPHALDGRDAPELAKALHKVVQKGNNLSTALETYPRCFPPLYVGLVRVGERTGTLSTVMPQLATYLSRQREIREKIAAAATYPAIVIIIALLAMVVVSVVVVPSVSEMGDQLGMAAPAQMELVIRRVERLSTLFWIGAAFVAGLAIVVRLGMFSRTFAMSIDRLLLKLPGAGPIVQRSQIAQLMFAMESLTKNGISVEEAIQEATHVVRNRAIRADLDQIHEKLQRGMRLSDSFLGAKAIPERVGAWARVGEHTGDIASVFAQMRHYYAHEVDRSASRLTSLVEPALIVLVGAGIIVVVLRVVVPLFGAMRGVV